ncbi:UDP-N-acetylmuramoylalanine--D-glutamate ligase [Candidatus Giovannonibacteria bacterium RIFCSPLOWO2_01_FULL_44_40]|uniref:UDP-N-acetylmuramoylalanine--D-glutamate ligase n=1 Tax=Candidatus Giovannonibacteria bacterium RIFCSPHIGHO2_01_FULL_45_23 TaxID=1798325 RepID=A0A1F5VH18_9BACT|nr:MAG: UDP-N-acetylmuramoylalanine--D-glutamate ligase [Candidatus Giovannonibacteria bacterium RIFCSPHIGHO2_01_FULL_45_23]OGF75730.1 MAG: UDP-N-acetylmuramoylalanine--D-glutamate ligase [Candidatus Giovannonibacteria bacterium RIFCSPHIGHO2_02_FULL_45_13]OGF79967.1 MAG: UDP-N-acetylmuramoylalanine--D-glutamate ligase [Candidatus Giovannonibacteria bacterium RIFCSPLOWO2_01_FULL_44_40]
MNPARKKVSNGVKIAILGYGVEGKSAERFFKRLGCPTPKREIEIRDVKRQGRNYLKNLDKFDMIVRSPGVPYLLPEIQKAKKAGVKITSATKLFFAALDEGFYGSRICASRGKEVVLFSKTPLSLRRRGVGGEVKIIGITGTKGKGTTATLLYQILKASGKDVFWAGNIGRPMLDILPRLKRNSIVVLELSSFQLQDLDRSPDIAVVLDISPDHLNYHKSFKEYLNTKARLVSNLLPRHQIFQDTRIFLLKNRSARTGRTAQGLEKFVSSSIGETLPTIFFFPDNKYSKLIASKSHGKKIAVLPDPDLILQLSGPHNLKNASMAATISANLDVSQKIIRKTVQNFKGLPHRLEFVRKVGGVSYYNDSASTNPAATIAALKSFTQPKILIAGGQSKGLGFKPLGAAVKKSNTKLVILCGQNKSEIGLAIGKAAPIIKTHDLKSAVKLANKKAARGDVVILSPASTAFDMFSGYAERGRSFKKFVHML